MPDELPDALTENAKGPKRVKGDAGEVEQHPLSEQTAADRYLNSKKAAKRKGLGIKVSKLVPPGTE